MLDHIVEALVDRSASAAADHLRAEYFLQQPVQDGLTHPTKFGVKQDRRGDLDARRLVEL
ncbi:hypothetical protein D3C80_1657140 [compost metagenome]